MRKQKSEEEILQEAEANKNQADELWDRTFQKALNGNINLEEVYQAMLICDTTEKNVTDIRTRLRLRKLIVEANNARRKTPI